LNVGQTSDNPVDCLKTPAKPRRVSPNPNALSDHTLDRWIGSSRRPIMGRPSMIRERLVLRSDWLDRWMILEESGSAPRLAATFFRNRVDESVWSSDLGHACVRGWLNWPLRVVASHHVN
jgi:hypothetical protein